MRLIVLGLFTLGLHGCASLGVSAEELSADDPNPLPVENSSIPDAPLAAPTQVCPVAFGPVPTPDVLVPPLPSAPCWSPSPPAVRRLASAYEKTWLLPYEGAKISVSSQCDHLGPLREVVFEVSSGHGFSLRLFRLTKRDDGDWDLLALRYGPARTFRAPSAADDPDDPEDPWADAASVGGLVHHAVFDAKQMNPSSPR